MAYEYNIKQHDYYIIYNYFCQVKLRAKLNNMFFFQNANKKARIRKTNLAYVGEILLDRK